MIIALWSGAVLVVLTVLISIFFVLRAQRKLSSADRLKNYLKSLAAIEWKADRLSSLDTIADAVVRLILHELEYYYKLRNRRSSVAMATRCLAFIFAMGGFLAPLIAASFPQPDWHASEVGYVMLALAGGAFAANQLFGATAGHIRFVVAQYAIERRLQDFALVWQRWRARLTGEPEAKAVDKAFVMLRQLSADAYKIMEDETERWARMVTDAETSFGQRFATAAAATTKAKPAS